MNMSLSKLWKIVKDKQARHVAVHGVAKSRTQLSTEQQPPMVTLWVLEAIFHCWHKITVTTIAAATITIIYIYDEAGTVLILKKEKQVWRGLHMGLAHLTLLRVLLFQDHKDPPRQIWALVDNQGPSHTTKILQSSNQLILEIQATEPSFSLQGFCRPPHWLLCPATVVTTPTS